MRNLTFTATTIKWSQLMTLKYFILENEEEKNLRRVSYLQATKEEIPIEK